MNLRLACLVTSVALAGCFGSGGGNGGPLPGDDLATHEPADMAVRPVADLAGTHEPPPDLSQPVIDVDMAQSTSTGDGTPTRQQCTSSYGSSLSTQHGRLDGYLVSIVPPGHGGCNADSSHVHLQVEMHGAVYDVAVDVVDKNGAGVFEDLLDTPLLDGAWSEGWHPGDALDYVGNFGLHAGDFTQQSPSGFASKLESELASANHVAVFATGYNANGCHLVHRENGGNDGAIVLDPLSSTPHWILLHFADQSF